VEYRALPNMATLRHPDLTLFVSLHVIHEHVDRSLVCPAHVIQRESTIFILAIYRDGLSNPRGGVACL
jgi:hypothetical protein